MSRKDSKGMFAAVLGQLGDEQKEGQQKLKSASPHLLKVAAGVRQLQERSELADRLFKDGERIAELDPEMILPSPVPDRFEGAYDDKAIAEIVESMRERGQIVPGLVRHSPAKPGHFQIVYGRRRLAAAKKLGLKFKAAVRELTDDDAVILQGEENSGREDLSFIEKCSFALAQEQAGYKRDVICASLSTGKSHVSEMIKIAFAIPREILMKIGSAPGVGRGRWEELAHKFGVGGNSERAGELVTMDSFLEANSDNRFNLLLAFLSSSEAPTAEKATKPTPVTKAWAPTDGSVSAVAKDNGKAFTLALKNADGTRFGAFITDQLDSLYEAFRNSEARQTGD
ncbi:plasmid partitioning protein RepB [Mesorhizobium sp. M5C.F.Cr.IN.023.01.1.1]|uniref:plasmid partitioning protein RepB n=1 Tax=Mesorhizobium sp. M5C.F.Cr.IN.023.01.1.1 TaxID=2496768 RepID=UPI000FCA642F|nr:plasmid partitioning protein RepB [Mesorhizobium sp. M5C.F.Cr.IN.023.01.1.1]RUV77488.1 plasmid partitioning protein RepB [Mesorhizobium sp. M5C.F.Cr.IN.023.01.1.1]